MSMSDIATHNANAYRRMARVAARCGLVAAAARYAELAARWNEVI